MSLKAAFYAAPLVFAALVAVVLLMAWWPALVAAGTSVAVVIVIVVVVLALSVAIAAITGVFNVVAGTFFGLKNRSLDVVQRRQEMTLAEREQQHRHEMDRIAASRFIIRATHDSRETAILPELGIIAAQLPAPAPDLPANVPHHYAPSWSINISKPTAKEDRTAIAAAEQAQLSAGFPTAIPLLSTLERLRAEGKLNAANMDILLGVSQDGQPLIVPTRDVVMSATVGSTGSGKSSFTRSLISQWVAWNENGAPNMLVAIDHDRRELPIWQPAMNLYRYSDEPDETNRLIPHLYQLMTQRAELPEAERYNLPWVIIAIEEIIDVVDELTPDNRKLLDKLVRRSRDTNFRIFSMAQYWRVTDLGKAVQSQARSRFLGACDDRSARDFGFTTDLIPSGTPGRFTYRLATGASGQLQAPLISAADVQQHVLRLPASASSTPGAPRIDERPTLRIVKPDDQGESSDETEEMTDFDRRVLAILQGDILNGKTGDKAIAEYLSETGPTKISHNAVNRSKAKLAKLCLISA